MHKSYIHKIKDLRIVSGSMKNPDTGESIEYKSTQLVILTDGQEEVLTLSGRSPIKPNHLELALRGADDVGTHVSSSTSVSDFLED